MKTLILSLIILTTLSCSKNNDPAPTPAYSPTTITPILIGKGNLSGRENIPQQNITIYNSADWNNLLSLIQVDTVSEFTETTTLNFNNYQLIALFDNIYPSPKFDIKITSITENVDNIIVNYQKISTSIINSVYAQSFYIVKIPKYAKQVIFQIQP